MKYKIVFVPFPFDDLSATKVRPAICLTDEIQPYGHIVLAFITSKVSASPSSTDLTIDSQTVEFCPNRIESFFDNSPASSDDNLKNDNSAKTRRIIVKSADGNRKPFAKIIWNLKNNQQSLTFRFQFQIQQSTGAKRLAARQTFSNRRFPPTLHL